MSKWRFEIAACAVACAALISVTGCSTVGSAAADLGLAGAGGVAGYQLSGQKVGGAAAGAAVGYLASRVAQSEVQRTVQEAEKRGYDRALNQAVKQQYWIIQDQQRSREPADSTSVRCVPVQLPETTVDGVIHNPTTANVPFEP